MKKRTVLNQRYAAGLLVLGGMLSVFARAEMSAEELAKMTQNPVANLISVPFQNNTNRNYSPPIELDNIEN